VKGQSGNPSGRPLKERTLTKILEAAGNKTIEVEGDDKRVARKRLTAEVLWQAASTGKATFPKGDIFTLDIKDWFDVTQFLYKQIDGPPQQAVDVTSGGKELKETQIDDTRFDRAILTLADALRKSVPGESDKPNG
jgi:hypothetical protein